MKQIEVEFGLSDKVRLKNDPDVTAFVLAIFITWSGITYQICEPNGTITNVDMEEIEDFVKKS